MLSYDVCAKCRYDRWGFPPPLYLGEKSKRWACPAKVDTRLYTRELVDRVCIKDNPPAQCPRILEHAVSLGMAGKDVK